MELGGQIIYLVIDTLVPTTWVRGVGDHEHSYFVPSNATSFYDSGKGYHDPFYQYDGEIVASDINISGEKANNVFFNFINYYVYFPGAGVIGMGHNPSQGFPITNSTPNPIVALYQQKAIKNNLFSLYLQDEKGGLLTLGETDTTLYTGNISYFSVKDKDLWEIDLDDVIVNGKNLGIKGHKITLDTGFPNIFVSNEYSKKINELIDAKLLGLDYIIPCNTTANVSFVIGGVEYKIKSGDLTTGIFASDFRLPPDGWCMSAIYGVNDTNTSWHFGGTFFRNIYAVFDYENSRVGLAQAAPRNETSLL
ncbi:aspartic peptidase domain-containing protein [Gigaspora rosea]|uniref:Aspartic peptidase domain-containing protein n=1 Tax=Gigaspora rosea TaxID=44941 RepID=A0A397VAP1_9GLOM|nr:aspartic peptidase domain-containing protein [Gigaspora rosea]